MVISGTQEEDGDPGKDTEWVSERSQGKFAVLHKDSGQRRKEW